jgi:S1-C subfamily serine protease
MKKVLFLFFIIAFFIGCATVSQQVERILQSTYKLVDDHAVTIVVNYYMSDEEYEKRIEKIKNDTLVIRKTEDGMMYIVPQIVFKLNDFIELSYKQVIVVPTKPGVNSKTGEPVKCISYIGSGTILKQNYILSVRHLFTQDINTYDSIVWVFKQGLDHAVEADLVALSDGIEFCDDYAIAHMKEDLGLPGLKIAEPGSLQWGDKVISTGSPGGLAFFHRVGFVTELQYFVRRVPGDNNALTLLHFEEFKYWVVYPGGPGDSGGSVKNLKGEIEAVLYCGVNVYEEEYIFCNPLEMLWCFLESQNLAWLGK